MRSQDCRYQHRLWGVSLPPAPRAPTGLRLRLRLRRSPPGIPFRATPSLTGLKRGKSTPKGGGGLPSPWPALQPPLRPPGGGFAPPHRCTAVPPPKIQSTRRKAGLLVRADAFWKIQLQRQRPRPSRTIVLLTGVGKTEGLAPKFWKLCGCGGHCRPSYGKGEGASRRMSAIRVFTHLAALASEIPHFVFLHTRPMPNTA